MQWLADNRDLFLREELGWGEDMDRAGDGEEGSRRGRDREAATQRGWGEAVWKK